MKDLKLKIRQAETLTEELKSLNKVVEHLENLVRHDDKHKIRGELMFYDSKNNLVGRMPAKHLEEYEGDLRDLMADRRDILQEELDGLEEVFQVAERLLK